MIREISLKRPKTGTRAYYKSCMSRPDPTVQHYTEVAGKVDSTLDRVQRLRAEISLTRREVDGILCHAQTTIHETNAGLEQNYREQAARYIGEMILAKIEATYCNFESLKQVKAVPRVALLARPKQRDPSL